MNLTQKTTKGIFWSGTSTVVTTTSSFLIIAILARILSPSDFGIIAIIMVVMNFAIMLSDLGIGMGVIQKKDITNEELSSFFFLNIFLGIISCVVIFCFSPILAKFFKSEELIVVLRLISFSFILISVGQIQKILLQKLMDFKNLAKVEIVGTITYGIISIYLAYKGLGVKSVVIGFLVRQTIEAILLWTARTFVPQLAFKPSKIKSLIKFGGYVTGERIVNYFSSNLDYIIIIKLFGNTTLGYYTLAHQLMIFPLAKISGVITRVIFPSFSIIQDNTQQLRMGYLKAIKYISFITFPMMVGLFIIAPEFVRVVYGVKWNPAIPVIRILCLVGILKSIGTIVGTIFYSQGRPDIGFKLNLFILITLVPAILLGSKWGINGVATSILLLSCLFFIINQYFVNRLINLHFVDFFKNLRVIATSSISLFLIAFGCKFLLKKSFLFDTNLIMLIFLVIIGGITYVLITLLQEKNIISEAKSLILSGVK